MQITNDLHVNEKYIQKSKENLLFLKNCEVYVNNKHINDINPVLVLSNIFFPMHGHLFDAIWTFYYYIELKKTYENVILILPNYNYDYSIKDWLNLMGITDNYILSNNISINYNNNTDVKPLFFINDIWKYEIDISESIKYDSNEKIKKTHHMHSRLWNDRDTWYTPNTFRTNINVRYNAYDKLIVVVDCILKNLSKISVEKKYIQDKVYLSRVNDTPQKFYYMENIYEITNYLKDKNFLVLSPLSKLSILEKLLYCNNSKIIISEFSSGLFYLMFAKLTTKIIIMVNQVDYFKNSPLIYALKQRFTNLDIVTGYDISYKILKFGYFSVYGFKNENLSTQILFYFSDEEKMKNIFKDKFKFYQQKKICMRSHTEITDDSLIYSGCGNWYIGFKNHILKNKDYNHEHSFKKENMYEYINNTCDDSIYKNSPYYDVIKYIPGNRINNRLSVSKSDFNNIINICKNNDIDVTVFADNMWYITKYYIKKEDLAEII